MKLFLKALDSDKIKINWNKNLIKMELFLSFLTVNTERQKDFLGYDNGWTQLTGDGCLVVKGGVVKGVEYLDSLNYGKNLDNPYNNFVNPFYLFNILTSEGKEFFLEYYAEDITAILTKSQAKANYAKTSKEDTFDFWDSLGVDVSKI